MNKFYEKWKQWQYYLIIGIISAVALFFLPMIGSEAGLAWNIPTTTVGWIVYITSKLLVATINIMIFHCFILQAKINIQDDAKYIEAVSILDDISDCDTESFRSPGEYFRSAYGKKGVTIFVTSILSAVGLTQAVLTFDLVSMLTYFFTILMGVIFGILQMNQTETYWTSEYLRYARKTKEAMELAEKESVEQRDDIADPIRGTGILESPDYDSSTSNTN